MTVHDEADSIVRALLLAVSSSAGPLPEFDPTDTPSDPIRLFGDWFVGATCAEVPEPRAMTLAVPDAAGNASARMVVMRDVDADGWHFVVDGVDRKAFDLAAGTYATVICYWPEVGRQVRVDGPVLADPRPVRRGDFLAQPSGSRLLALTTRHRPVITDPDQFAAAMEQARAERERQTEFCPQDWASYVVKPNRVEFRHDDGVRPRMLRYDAVGDSWARSLVDP